MWIFSKKARHQRRLIKAYTRYHKEIAKISGELNQLHQEASDLASSIKKETS